MKKQLLLTSLMLTLASVSLMGCSKDNVASKHNDPIYKAEESTNTVYLVLSSIGLYNGNPGTSYEEMYLENAIQYTAVVGEALPTKEEITTITSSNSEFVGWVSYEGLGAPTNYTTMPSEQNKILYAQYKSLGAGGGGGGGGGEETTTWTFTVQVDCSSLSASNYYLHAWCTDGTALGTWGDAGEVMTKGENSVYSYTLSIPLTKSLTGLILYYSNGSGYTQTNDITAPYDSSYNGKTGILNITTFNKTTISVDGVTPEQPVSETNTYYLYDPNAYLGTSNIRAYAWVDGTGTSNASWPGEAMTLVSTGVYSIELDEKYNMIIFNNGSSQTVNISMTSENANQYYKLTGGSGTSLTGSWVSSID